MHKLVLGIEHLMTGVQVMGKSESQVFQFHRESPSMVAIVSDEPFDSYWPVNHAFIQSTEYPEMATSPEQYGTGEVEHYAKRVVPAMVKADEWPDMNPPLPWPVVKAMRNKFGSAVWPPLSYDSICKCWMFTYCGMVHGVEPDGYIHT